MTIPCMMNCDHSGDGWCLSCVKAMGEENARLINRLNNFETAIRELIANVGPNSWTLEHAVVRLKDVKVLRLMASATWTEDPA